MLVGVKGARHAFWVYFHMIVSESFLKTWFALQRQLIAGLQAAYVDLYGKGVVAGQMVTTFPEDLEHSAELALAAELARRSGAPVTNVGEAAVRVAYPLQVGADASGAVVVEVEASVERQAAIIQLLQWGEAWLRLAVNQNSGARDVLTLTDVVSTCLTQKSYKDALTAALALLPDRIGCTRVSAGLLLGQEVRIEAVSQVTGLSPKSNRVRAIEQAMIEAVTANGAVFWTAETENAAMPAHHRLGELGQLAAVYSFPVFDAMRSPRVFSFEFVTDRPSDSDAQRRCEEAARLLAPALELRRDQERGWYERIAAGLNDYFNQPSGLRRRVRQLGWILGLLAAFIYLFTEGVYKVTAPATIEGLVQRAIVAPFDGYIAEALFRAGQEVEEGTLLARLDDQELRAERRKLLGEHIELDKQYNKAVAAFERGQAQILRAQLTQTQARLALVEDRLVRTELRAPFAGVILSGDWSRSLGVPVTRGDVLFEVAPLKQYRVALMVSDADIAEMAAGQQGELVLSALPRDPVFFEISGVATLAEPESTEPVFRVEAHLREPPAVLRPGMEGVAKIKVGQRPRWWIWSHRLTEWLSQLIWRWSP